MTKIRIVTTFHQEGYEKYGKRFLTSFQQKVDKNIVLMVYAEKCNIDQNLFDPAQIRIIDADTELSKLQRFKNRWKDDPKANGIPPDEIKQKRPNDHHKTFKWDAVRFANKVYAVFDAAEKCNKDWLIWMDADTFIHSHWSYDEMIKLLPPRCWLTYVGRGQGSQTWPECGFYGLNLNSIVCKEFLKEFERKYENAENGIFKMIEWHDSFVFGQVLKNYKQYHPNILDYTSGMKLKNAKTGGGGHPLINTELGKWMDHLKGDRKDKMKSNKPGDVVFNRNAGYWS